MKIPNTETNKNRVVGATIGLTLMLLMVIGIIFRVYYFTEAHFPRDGYAMIVNDPGKIFFHLILLPIIAFCLVSYAPYDSFREIIKNKTILIPSVVIISVIALLMLKITINDFHSGFCVRSPTPDNFKNADIRRVLCESWAAEHSKLKEYLKTTPDDKLDYSIFAKFDSSYREQYNHFRTPICPYFGGSSIFSCNYFGQSSISANIDGLLTYLTLLTGLFLLVTLLVHIFYIKTSPTLYHASSIQVILVLALLWFPMRWYSEWYINFGNIARGRRHFSENYQEFVLAAFFFIILLLLNFSLSKKKVQQRFDSFVTTIAGFEFLTITLLKMFYSVFEMFAELFIAFRAVPITTIYVLGLIAIFSFVLLIISKTNKAIREQNIIIERSTGVVVANDVHGHIEVLVNATNQNSNI